MKKHDESKDLRLVSRVCRIDYAQHQLSAPKWATIGIHMWGKIDYLIHYCGWTFIWNNESAGVYISPDDSPKEYKRKKEIIKKMKG